MIRSALSLVLTGLLAAGCGGNSGGAPDGGADGSAGYPPGAPAVSWFRQVAGAGGIDAYHLPITDSSYAALTGSGLALGDVDGDGRVDVVVTGGGAAASLYLNRGALSFADATAGSGIDSTFRALAAALDDLDGDGDLDLILGGVPGFATAGQPMIQLYDNDGSGGFTLDGDAGIATTDAVHDILVADLDADGWPDVYLAQAGDSDAGAGDRLFRNRGDGSFEEITGRVGLQSGGFAWTARAVDYDDDGDLDLYVANDQFVEDDGESALPPGQYRDVLYANDGAGDGGYLALRETAAGTPVSAPRSTMGITVADFDGDGARDLYLSDFGRNDLLLGDGSGGFTEAAADFGLAATRIPGCEPGERQCLLVSWGSALADFDLDGRDDLLVVNSALNGVEKQQPVALWRGTDGGLEAVQTELGETAGRALMPADLDGDGDLDLLITTWAGPLLLFENVASDAPSGFLRLRAAGPGAAGALVRVELDGGRLLERRLAAGGAVHSARPSEAHFGLGDATIAAAEIVWPSGLRQQIGAARDQVVDVAEPVLVQLTPPVAPADGASEVAVVITPRAADGSPLGAGHDVAVASSVGSWQTPVTDSGDGSYRGVLSAPASAGLAVLEITVDGTRLPIAPRVTFE